MNYKILIVDDEQLERRALESIIVLHMWSFWQSGFWSL